MFNKTTGETFPVWTKVDPKTLEELIKRHDDNEDAILTRIEEFLNKTLPIVHQQMNEDKVIEIDADQSIEKVFSDIESALNLK
jgi:adenylate kinase